MQIKVLGPLEAIRDGEPVDLGPPKQREVLSLLLMNAGRVVTTERLLEAVWGDEADAKENALWVTISRLRATLDPDRGGEGDTVLMTRDHGYVLDVDSDAIDATQFTRLAAEGRRLLEVDPAKAEGVLSEALGLWRGDAWPDVRYHDFAQVEVNTLEGIRLGATEDLLDARLRQGETEPATSQLEALAAEHPLRERPVRLLMLGLYASGRQAEALRAYSMFERRLGEEMGIQPSPELRRLEEQVLLHDPAVQAPAARVAGSGNPFKGLAPFREEDAAEFFGRDRLTADIIRRIGDGETLLTLVGASGSGKSSVVRAGVVPAIRKGALPHSDRWLVATMVPGVHPIAELEAALIRSSLESPASLGDQLADPEEGFLRATLRVLPDDDSRLVLIVDQFEELFTIADYQQRDRFLDGLLAACSDHRGRVVVVLTLRADFYDRPLQHPEFAARFGDGVVNVPPLLPDELEVAALKPAERVGASIEPALLGALLADVLGRPGSLPLFQYVLTDLFERSDGDLTLDAYRALGGIGGALSKRAEETYASFDPDEQAACQQLFLRMVAVADGANWSRRRLHAEELRSMGFPPETLQAVVGGLADARLVTTDREPTTGRPTIEVAHEALMSEWDRLATWIKEAHDDLRRHAALSVAVREWHDAEQDPGYLWAGTRLADYREWADTAAIDLTVDERLFLASSAATEEIVEREEAVTRRRTKRRGWWLAATLVGLVGLGLVALWPVLFPPPEVLLVTIQGGNIADQFREGMEAAETHYGIRGNVVSGQTDGIDQVTTAFATNPDLVIAALDAHLLGVDWYALTENHPDTSFVDISDGAIARPREDEPGADQWVTVSFANHEGAFLAGAVAAERTATGTIGFVGGHPGLISDFRAGYEAGAAATDPDVEVVSIHTPWHPDAWLDFQSAARSARAVLAEGADVLFHAHGDAGRAVLVEAADAGAWGIGVDSNEYLRFEAEGDPATARRVLTSVLKRFDLAVVYVVRDFLDGELDDIEMNLSNDGFGLATEGDHMTEAEKELQKRLQGDISSGAITVPEVPEGPAQLDLTGVIVVDLVAGSQGCELGPIPEVGVGEALTLRLTNDSTEAAGFAIGPLEPGVDPAVIPDSADDWWLFFEEELTDPWAHNEARPRTSSAAPVTLDRVGHWAIGCWRLDSDADMYRIDYATFEVGPTR